MARGTPIQTFLLATQLVACANLGALDGGDGGSASVDGGDGGSASVDGGDGGSASVDSGDGGRPPVDAGMHAISLAQTIQTGSLQTGMTLATAQVDVSGGDLLVVGAYWQNPSAVAVTDTLGNGWSSTPSLDNRTCNPDDAGVGNAQLQFWYAENATGGSDTITMQLTENDGPFGFYALEYTGIAPSASLDAVIGQVAPSSTNAESTGSLTTTGAFDVVVALFGDLNGTGLMTPGSGYSVRGTDTFFYSLIEDDLPTGATPGSYDPTASLPQGTADSCWVARAIAFKAR